MLKEIIAGLVVGILFSGMILGCAEREQKLIKEHCSNLTGYEYGQCQTNIY